MDTSRAQAPLTAPASLADLLAEFRGCFSAWTFPVFCALACGMLAQTGRRTVCAMLVGARLSRVWSHHRAHRFFSHARWSVDAVSATLARLVVRLLVGPDEAVTVAVDDTLFRRRGPKVFAASWFHDGSAQGDKKVGYGNNWVIAAIVLLLASGYAMIFFVYAGFGGVGLHVHIMQAIGIVMMLAFFHLYFAPWRRFPRLPSPPSTSPPRWSVPASSCSSSSASPTSGRSSASAS